MEGQLLVELRVLLARGGELRVEVQGDVGGL